MAVYKVTIESLADWSWTQILDSGEWFVGTGGGLTVSSNPPVFGVEVGPKLLKIHREQFKTGPCTVVIHVSTAAATLFIRSTKGDNASVRYTIQNVDYAVNDKVMAPNNNRADITLALV